MVLTSTPREKAQFIEQAAVQGRSLWDDARARLMRNKAAVTGLVILAVLVFLAFIGPLLWVHESDVIYRDRVQMAPTLENLHLFGTDAQGRDLFARVLVGLRMSLMVGVVATMVSLAIGVVWGATAGFLGGRVDQIMMRIVDVLYSLPFIFFVIILMVVFGRNIILIFVAIGAVEWLTMARIVRGQTIALKGMEFVEAAQAAGVSQFSIIRRHIVPNVLGPVVVYVTLTIPVVILAESFLSFLGLGVQEPLTSLGNLISNGARDMEIAPWTLIAPAATMMLTLFCFNFLGDGLRDAIDPKDR
ncbi:ABC transporter permease subunit [Marinicauda algicola]|uniref:Oligopeptide transport system permease protein OppC n=1 Tax=Marinicauda algicola TaxID=2029849 RepID=A0A4S2GZS5_9PROT|nr:ABC transporter permease subunit [Marinicauda algicola]TGY88508.1 ABC transporter permease subunit [Marinicauda algicola]